MGLRKSDRRFAALAKTGGKSPVSQEIEAVREWLMDTYGGHWGTLERAALDVREMERKLLRQEREIERLGGNKVEHG